MSKQTRVVAALALVLFLGIGAAVFLVLMPGIDVEVDTNDTDVATVPEDGGAEVVEETQGTSRRRSSQKGSATIHGEVRRALELKPVAEQKVLLISDATGEIEIATDDEGIFRFESLPDGGPYEVRVTAEGFATVRMPGIALDRDEVRDVGTLLLDEAVQLEVEVRSLADVPIAGADVLAYAAQDMKAGFDWTKAMAQFGQEPVPVASVKTNAQGKALFPELAAGTWTVVAKKEGFSRTGRAGQRLRGKEEREPVVLYLGHGFELKGIVKDQDGKPIPGALVLGGNQSNVWNPQFAPLRSRSVAGDDGGYLLTALPAGDLTLFAGPPDVPPGQIKMVRVPSVSEFDIVLRDGGVLIGQVTMKDSKEPVVGATIFASSYGSFGGRNATAVTDEEGRYRIDTLPEGNVNSVTATKLGLIQDMSQSKRWQPVPLMRDETVTRDLMMSKGASVIVTVKGPDGPIGGVTVTAWGANPQSGVEQKRATTDAEGRAKIESLHETKQLIHAAKSGLSQLDFPQNAWQAVQQGNIPDEYAIDATLAEDAEITITLSEGSYADGKVEDEDGQPISGALVTVQPVNGWWGWNGNLTSSTSKEDGSFRIHGITTGTEVRFVASKMGFVTIPDQDPVEIKEDGPTSEVVVKMRKAGLVRGTVFGDSGEAVEDTYVQIALQPDNSGGWTPWTASMMASGQTKYPVRADGSFEVPLTMSKGAFTITARAPGVSPVTSERKPLVDGQTEYEVDLVFGAVHSMTGSVRQLGTGTPIADAHVTIASKGGGNNRMRQMSPMMSQFDNTGAVVAVTGEDGTFAVENIPAAEYTVSAQAYGHVANNTSGRIPGSEILVELSAELEITGVIEFDDGKGVEGATVSAVKSDQAKNSRRHFNPWGGGGGNGVTDANGKFKLRGLAQGPYILKVQTAWGYETNIQPFDSQPIEAGATDVRLVARAGLSITGIVVDGDGEPIANANVNANPKKPKPGVNASRNTTTKEDGTFKLVGLDAESGMYTIYANRNAMGGTAYVPVQKPDIAPGTTNLRIVMKAGLAIGGTIRGADGKPIKGNMWIQAQPIKKPGDTSDKRNGGNSQGDAKGRFRIQGLAPGQYRLSMNAWGPAGAQGLTLQGGDDVTAGNEELKLTAVEGAKINGVVVDENGAAVQGANVNANPVGGGRGRNGQSKADGSFEISGLASGLEYNVTAYRNGMMQSTAGKVAAGTGGIRIVMRKGLTASGRVLAADGGPLAKSYVRLEFREQGGRNLNVSARTDDEGNFEAVGLEEGVTYSVKVWVRIEGRNTPKDLGQISGGEKDVTFQVPAE